MRIKILLFILLLCVCLFSCRSVKQIPVKLDIPNITEGKLLKNIHTAEPAFQTLYAKRMDVSVTQNDKTNSLRASMKIQRDSFIQISVSLPLGIEVGRILLTRDSIKFMDSFHKKYFLADYRYFSEKFDVNLTYSCFQDILTNTFFNFENCIGTLSKEKRYKFEKSDKGYVLSTVEEKSLSRKIKKLYKKRRKNKDFVLILQKIEIDPQTFRPLKMSIEDVEEEIGVSVNYMDFQNFGEEFFPGKIIFDLFSDNTKAKLEIKFLRLEFNIDVDPNFRISHKYQRIQ